MQKFKKNSGMLLCMHNANTHQQGYQSVKFVIYYKHARVLMAEVLEFIDSASKPVLGAMVSRTAALEIHFKQRHFSEP